MKKLSPLTLIGIVSLGLTIATKLFGKEIWKISKKAKIYLSNETIDLINYFGEKYQIPAGSIAGMVLTEIWDNPLATGSIGEIGILQITKGAFNEVDKHYDLNFSWEQCYTKRLGLIAGMLYYKILHDVYGLNWYNSIKAYNCGTDLKPVGKCNEYYRKVSKWL